MDRNGRREISVDLYYKKLVSEVQNKDLLRNLLAHASLLKKVPFFACYAVREATITAENMESITCMKERRTLTISYYNAKCRLAWTCFWPYLELTCNAR